MTILFLCRRKKLNLHHPTISVFTTRALGMRPRATLPNKVKCGLRAGQNPFTGRIRPAGRMLPMLGVWYLWLGLLGHVAD